MWQIQTSGFFDRQLFNFAQNYKDIADLKTADRFLDCVDEAIHFIARSPLTCAVYFELQKVAGLEEYEFRKWRVKVFPFSIFFRIKGEKVVVLEAIYAQKMDILNRLPSEMDLAEKE
ncbi:MAG: type II toxin-antitoxin system RelE/ParE family toxin [bacterium]|nr:type II toxin-antitoxin system RelE/ParE family toxin [bacterium]